MNGVGTCENTCFGRNSISFQPIYRVLRLQHPETSNEVKIDLFRIFHDSDLDN